MDAPQDVEFQRSCGQSARTDFRDLRQELHSSATTRVVEWSDQRPDPRRICGSRAVARGYDQLAVDDPGHDRAASGREVAQRGPLVGGRIVRVDCFLRAAAGGFATGVSRSQYTRSDFETK